MIFSDETLKEGANAFVPPVSDGYERMVADTVSKLKASGRERAPKRSVALRVLSAAAAVLAALVMIPAVVFAARPALAAEVPVAEGIVYALSPAKAAGEADCERIGALVTEVFRAFAFRDYASAESLFKDGAMHTRESYIAAAYTEHMLEFGDALPESADACGIETAELSAERKAFRYTGRVTLNVLSKDGNASHTEECLVRVWENAEGMHIESIQMQSEACREFALRYEEAFRPVPEAGACFDLIPFADRCLELEAVNLSFGGAREREAYYGRIIAELDGVSAPAAEKEPLYRLLRAELESAEADITPAIITAEDAAAELMYRYWLARKTGEPGDFSDIMEHNEQTDLFLKDALLQADAAALGARAPLDTVERGSAMVTRTAENADGTFTAWIAVKTHITVGPMEGVGEDIVLTLRRGGGRLAIVGFDRETGDGLYIYTLKPLAEKLKAAGHSWQEAGEMAYEEAYKELSANAG